MRDKLKSIFTYKNLGMTEGGGTNTFEESYNKTQILEPVILASSKNEQKSFNKGRAGSRKRRDVVNLLQKLFPDS